MKTLLTILLLYSLSSFLKSQSNEFSLIATGFNGSITAISEDINGNIWIAINTPGTKPIVLISDEILDTLFIPTSLPIWGLDVDQQNNLWIATQDTGLIKYNGIELEYLDISKVTTRGSKNHVFCVRFDNQNNMWIGNGYTLAKFDGINWTVYDDLNSPLQVGPEILSIKFDENNDLWFAHYYGGGRFKNNVWTFWDTSPFSYMNTVAIAKDGSVWFGPTWGSYINLIDDTTWIEYNFLATPHSSHQIAVDTNNIVWLGVFQTSDPILAYNGSTFNNLEIPFNELGNASLKSIYVDKNNKKWFGFSGGFIVKYTGDFPTHINQSGHTNPDEFRLFQNFPNPFNPNTIIKYQLPVTSQVTLKVYDILGREIMNLVNEEKTAGSYEVEFNASSLSSGIYFYKLQAKDFSFIKKMIILR